MYKKSILFTANRYFVYSIKLVQGIYLAKFIEPENFGIYGFLMLIQMYLSYTSLGIPLSINMELATDSIQRAGKKIPEAFTLISVIALVILLGGFVIKYNRIILFDKYSFDDYVLLTVIMACLALYRELFVDIYQVYGNLGRIAITEIISALGSLVVVFFFRGKELLYATLIVTIITGIVTMIIFLVNPPFKIKLSLKKIYVKPLISVGITLLAANISFYLITVSVRTVVSIFFPVELMGYFSFANSIANSTMLGLNAIGWVFYPLILSKTTLNELDENVIAKLKKVNDAYISLSFLTVYCAISILPLLFHFLPKYQPTEITVVILLLTQALLSTAFSYSTMAYARKQQFQIAKMSFLSLLLASCLSFLFAFLKLELYWQAIAVFVGMLSYVFFVIRLGSKLLDYKLSEALFKDVFTIGTVISIVCVIIGCIYNETMFAGIVGIIVYLGTHYSRIKSVLVSTIWRKTRLT